MASTSLNPNPKALFGTSLADTRKLLAALIDYTNRHVSNPLRGDVEALRAVISRESMENPTYWNAVASEVIRAYDGFQGGEYTFQTTGVSLFDDVLAQLDISLFDDDSNAPRRHLLWSGSSGSARSKAPRGTSVPPALSSSSESTSSTPAVLLAVPPGTLIKGIPARAPLVVQTPQPKGKGPSRRPSVIIEQGDGQGSPTPSNAGGTSRGDALINSAIRDFGALTLPRHSSAPPAPRTRPGASHSFDVRPATLSSGPTSATLLANRSPLAAPFGAPRDQGNGDESSDDGNDFVMADPSDPSPIQDDLDFVAALVQRPASDSRIGSVGTVLGQRIFNRTQAFRQLSNSQVREYALRSNAPLPLDVRIAIIRGEPVDYGKIPLYNPSAPPPRPLSNALADVLRDPETPSTKIKTFADWLSAHSKVVDYTLTLYEFRAEEFHSYTTWMRERATRTPLLFGRYIEFDHNVRHHLGLATYPDNLADAPGQFDLLNEIVHNPQHRQPPPPSSSSPSRTSTKRSASNSSSEACRRWNNGVEHEDNCRWAHQCSTCDSSQHVARECKGGGGAGRVAKKAKGNGGGGGSNDVPAVSLRK